MRWLFYLGVLFGTCACRQMQTIRPHRSAIVEAVYASGKIVSDGEYTAYALSSGTITRKCVQEGAVVKRGQVLYEIEADVPTARADAARTEYQQMQRNLSAQSRILNDLKLALQSAQAKRRNDSLQYFRLQYLFEQGIGMRSTVDNAYTAYVVSRNSEKAAVEKYKATVNELQVSLQNARSGWAAAQAELRNTTIRSGLDGTIYQTFKEAGETVRPNEAVALIGSSEKRIIQLAVDQQDIAKIKKRQEVLLKTDVTGNTIFKAVVDRIYPIMNEADQSFRVDAVFAAGEYPLFIHASVEANIIVQQKKAALLIPRAALLVKDSVQVKQGRRIKTVAVRLGIRSTDSVEVVSGLSESDQLILPLQK